MSAEDNKLDSRIAWAGWSIPAAGDWRPIKIEGGCQRGSMMIGDEERPVLLVQWLAAPVKGSFSGKEWIERRFKGLRAEPDPDVPDPDGFEYCSWIWNLQVREEKGKSLWCGYSPGAGLLVELITTTINQKPGDMDLFREVAAGLRSAANTGPVEWRIYDVGFASPSGYKLADKRLFSGDMGLLFEKGKRETLTVRQVYPAGLAVNRRSLESWLDRGPFVQRRRLSDAAVKRPWKKGPGERYSGIKRRGWKRLPSPMGFCAARFSSAVAVTDAKLDRLLIAEHLVKKDRGDEIAEWAVENMNADVGTPR